MCRAEGICFTGIFGTVYQVTGLVYIFTYNFVYILLYIQRVSVIAIGCSLSFFLDRRLTLNVRCRERLEDNGWLRRW
jgi:hypothetical protein